MAAGPTKAWAVLVHEAKQQSPASRRILPLPRGMLEVCWGRGGVVLVDAVVMVEMAGGACFGFGLLVCLNVWLAERAHLTSSIAATTQSVVDDALAFV